MMLPSLMLALNDAAAGHGSLADAVIPKAVAAPELRWAGWILLLPAISAVLCTLLAVLRTKSKLPALVTVLSLGTCFAMVLKLYLSRGPDAGPVVVHLWD